MNIYKFIWEYDAPSYYIAWFGNQNQYRVSFYQKDKIKITNKIYRALDYDARTRKIYEKGF